MTPGTLVMPVSTEQALLEIAIVRGMAETELDRSDVKEGVERVASLAAQALNNQTRRALIEPAAQDRLYAQFLDMVMPHEATARPASAHQAIADLVSMRTGEKVELTHQENADGCGLTAIKVDELAA